MDASIGKRVTWKLNGSGWTFRSGVVVAVVPRGKRPADVAAKLKERFAIAKITRLPADPSRDRYLVAVQAESNPHFDRDGKARVLYCPREIEVRG